MASHDNYDKNILKALQEINKSLRTIADSLSKATTAAYLHSEAQGTMDNEKKNTEMITCEECIYYNQTLAHCYREEPATFKTFIDSCEKGVSKFD